MSHYGSPILLYTLFYLNIIILHTIYQVFLYIKLYIRIYLKFIWSMKYFGCRNDIRTIKRIFLGVSLYLKNFSRRIEKEIWIQKFKKNDGKFLTVKEQLVHVYVNGTWLVTYCFAIWIPLDIVYLKERHSFSSKNQYL